MPVLVVLLALLALGVATPGAGADFDPSAATWPTFVLAAPSALRPPPPADHATEAVPHGAEAAGGARADGDAGPPSYRWNQLAVAESLRANQHTVRAARDLAVLHVALHDALIAAWDAKVAYRGGRAGAPSYPDAHAVVAGAASAVLAYLHPSRAALYVARAEAAARSRVRSRACAARDADTGLSLGRAVAARVVARARADGSDRRWTVRVPGFVGSWTGADPVLPGAAAWRPWVLASPAELRPPPPPPWDSARMAAELEELRRFRRSAASDAAALFWEYGAGGARGHQFWSDRVSRTLLEQRLDDPPRAARAYALVHVALADAAIACWDAKYAYWAIRPAQLDPAFRPLFPTPAHPSYPSGHSCLSTAAATVLGRLFPRDAAAFDALAAEASESRLWAGIHFRSDVTAGSSLGRAVALRVLERMAPDLPR